MKRNRGVIRSLVIFCLIFCIYVSGNQGVQARVVSALKISGYGTVASLTEGQAFNVKGMLSSNFKITKATAYIQTNKGTMKYQQTAVPNRKIYDLSKFDKAMRFSALKSGSYVFKIDAADASGNSINLLTQNFRVQSNIKVTGYNALTSITEGQELLIKGTVSSNYNLTKVTAYISTNKGQVKNTKSATPNATSYNLGDLAKQIRFDLLKKGNYVLKVDAVDASKTTKNVIEQEFNVIQQNVINLGKNNVKTWLSDCKKALEYYATNGFSYGTASPHYVAPMTTNRKTNCAAYVSWCLYRNGFVKQLNATNQFAQGTAAYVHQLGWSMNTDINSIQAGDVMYYSQRNVTDEDRINAINWLQTHGPGQAGSGMHVDICYDAIKKQFLSAGSNSYIKTGKIATYGSEYLQKHFICSFRYPN